MPHRLLLLLPLALLAACQGASFPNSSANKTEASTNVTVTNVTTNVANVAQPANVAAPAPADANSANAAAPAGNEAAAQANGQHVDPNAQDRVGGRELDEGSSNLDFIVVNRTGRKIIGLSMKPFDDTRWTANVLAGRDVPNNERAAATFSRDVEICRWDLKATLDDGRTRVFPNINLCDTVRVELR
jgi:hypothetical protein